MFWFLYKRHKKLYTIHVNFLHLRLMYTYMYLQKTVHYLTVDSTMTVDRAGPFLPPGLWRALPVVDCRRVPWRWPSSGCVYGDAPRLAGSLTWRDAARRADGDVTPPCQCHLPRVCHVSKKVIINIVTDIIIYNYVHGVYIVNVVYLANPLLNQLHSLN